MFLGYGIAIAIIFEWWRRRKDRFKDPSASWVTDFVRDELMPVEEKNLSAEAKHERFLKRYNRQWRDRFGSESIYRLMAISSLVELYVSQKRYYEARGWQNLAIQIMEFNQVSGEQLGAAFDKLAELEIRMGRIDEASALFARAADIYRRVQNAEALARNLSAHFDAVANRGRVETALAVSDELVALLETLHGPTSMPLEEHLLRLEGSLERDKIPVSKSEHLRLLIALHISEEALGEDHRAVAGDLRKLASFLALRGKDQLAEQLLWRARMISLLNKVAGFDYPGIERDLLQVAEWLESRNQGADRTVAFHMRKRVERLAEKRFSKSKR